MNDGIFGFPGSSTDRLPGQIKRVSSRIVKTPNTSDDRAVLTIEVPLPGIQDYDFVIGNNGFKKAISADRPDKTIVGGNPRHAGSIDWQTKRNSPEQVSSWLSVICGGENNQTTGIWSIIGGGQNNLSAGGSSAIGGGQNNITSTGVRTICGGRDNTGYVVYGGQGNNASENFTGAFGLNSISSHQYDIAQGSGSFSSTGRTNRLFNYQRIQTINATPAILTFGGGAPGSTAVTRFIIEPDTQYVFEARIVAIQAAGTAGTIGDSSYWIFRGAIKRDISDNVSIVGTPSVQYFSDSGASSWTANIVANNIQKALDISVVGEVNKTIRWVCAYESLRLSF